MQYRSFDEHARKPKCAESRLVPAAEAPARGHRPWGHSRASNRRWDAMREEPGPFWGAIREQPRSFDLQPRSLDQRQRQIFWAPVLDRDRGPTPMGGHFCARRGSGRGFAAAIGGGGGPKGLESGGWGAAQGPKRNERNERVRIFDTERDVGDRRNGGQFPST